MSTSPNVLAVKDKVQRWLNDAVGSITIDKDGDFTFRFGSTQIFIGVIDQEDRVLVHLQMPLLFEVPLTPELYKYVATENAYFFGKLRVVEKDGVGLVGFEHTLLGDYLDAEELHAAIRGMVNSGDDVDNELQAKFGGRVFHEDDE